jgi:hypothetical protein
VCVLLAFFFLIDDFPQLFSDFFFWESVVARTPSGDVTADSANRELTLKSGDFFLLRVSSCGFGDPCWSNPSGAEILLLLLFFGCIGHSNDPRHKCVLYWRSSAAWDA